MNRRLSLTLTAGLLGAVLAVVATTSSGCASRTPRRDPVGEPFPEVRGESLAGDEVVFPAVGGGEPLLLLVGYVQDAQFDIDRWLLGVTQLGLDVRMFELPTIAGMVPRMFSGTIDEGMRGGIPREDWGGVVTIYGDAPAVVALTGDEEPGNARVLLVDGDGEVAWFHDRGYSVGAVKQLEAALAKLRGGR